MVRYFSPYTVQKNGLKFKPFRFLVNYTDQLLGKYTKWKAPKLQGDTLVDRIPVPYSEELRHRYKGAKWKGFPVFEDINRYKTDEYAQLLLKAAKFALEQGFNPFEYEKKAFLEFQQAAEKEPEKVWTGMEAFNYFMQEWEQRGLEDDERD